VRSHNVYASSTSLRARHHFTRQQRFCGDFMSPATISRPYVFMYSSRYFCSVVTKLYVSRQIFNESFQYQISRKPVQWDPRWYIWTQRRPDITQLLGALLHYSNAPNNCLRTCTMTNTTLMNEGEILIQNNSA
jgi:hypothetical protein